METIARIALTLLLTAAAPAMAFTPCDVEVRTLKLNSVLLDGVPTKIAGPHNRRDFDTWLAKCRPAAVPVFRSWRTRRQIVNTTAAVGAVYLWPLYIGTVWAGVDASAKRKQLDAILAAPVAAQ